MNRKIKDFISIIKNISNFHLLLLDYLGLKNNSNYVLKLRNGIKVYLRGGSNDKSRIKEILIKKSYFFESVEISDGAIIFDIGANIGLFSLNIANEKKELKIFAFEPESQNFELLLKQISINKLSNILAFKFAIGAAEGSFKLLKSTNTGGHTFVDDENFVNRYNINVNDYEIVKKTTLEKIIKDNNINKIDLLKMDIEGGEYEIFYNLNIETFNKIKYIVMEYHYIDNERNGDKLKELLISKGYTVKLKYPHLIASRI